MNERLNNEIITEKPGGFISKITFNNELSVDINEDDIVVLVGPNNSGKSQALKDIYELSNVNVPCTVVKNIEIKKNETDLESFLMGNSVVTDYGNYKNFSGFRFDFTSSSILNYKQSNTYGNIRPLFITYLSTLDRLTTCEPAEAIKRHEAKRHPIHYVAFDKKYRKWLSDNYKKAFGKEIFPHMQYGSVIPLCIGNAVTLGKEYEDADEQDRQEAYAQILDTYVQVHQQGDGIKSFVGILLNLMIDNYRSYLIDEPESFLHPPQANIMGRIIGETLSKQQQAFISTHSEDLIKGLLSVCPERVKVIRITRNDKVNDFSVLDNEKFDEIWKDPLLRHSNIMQSLFHNTVVLCESDSDCKMYSAIDDYLNQMNEKYSETLFIHCGGKHRMSKVANALRSLNVNVKLIADLDIMNDKNVFQGVIETFDIKWETIERDYNVIVSNLHSVKERVKREEAKTTINNILDKKPSVDLSSSEINGIKDAVSIVSKWDMIKRCGEQGIPSGDSSIAYQRVKTKLSDNGIHLVPVGEIEGFIRMIGGHGPEWANNVLEQYSDLSDSVYDSIKEFVENIGI